MTKSREIQIYWKALFNYRLTRILPFLSEKFHTDYGFCYYFQLEEGEFRFYSELPTLSKLEPNHAGDYWFPRGEKSTRINLLKKAIHILEQEAKDGRK